MAAFIDIDLKRVKRFENLLARMPLAVRFAERDTINDLAFETRAQSKKEIADKMVLRNRWTARSVMVTKARSLSDPSITGSAEEYMADQEFGGTRLKSGKFGVPIPTAYASGEGQTANPKRRLPRAKNKLSKLRLSNTKGRGANKRQRNAIAVQQAIKTGRREVFLDTGRKQFIARVTGGKASPRIRMIYDLSRGSTPIPRNPWLAPATDKAVKKRYKIYTKRLIQQLKRLR